MKPDELLDLIGETEEKYIRDAQPASAKKALHLKRWATIAACLVLVIGGVSFFLNNFGASAGGGSSGGLTYMSYAGPVFPMSIRGSSDGLSAQRNITLDFSPYIGGDGCTVTDRYKLTNQTDEPITATVLYPFAGSMSTLDNSTPSLSINDKEINFTLFAGPYSGGWSHRNFNLDSFEGYEALLSNGSYQSEALNGTAALEQTVIVYALSDFTCPSDTDAVNPTLNMAFHVDYSKTAILSYGMNGGTYSPDTNYCALRTSDLQSSAERSFEACVILVGEDLTDYTIQGYQDGGADPGEELDGIDCTITRYETTLSEILRQTAERFSAEHDAKPSSELLYALTAELLATMGFPEGSDGLQAYFMLEDLMSAAFSSTRVFYAAAEVVIPAGSSITVTAKLSKEASVDFYGKEKNRHGYAMATQLGSNLAFTEQTASIQNYSQIRILRQNFGFDLESGVTTVPLDLNQPHYWIEVARTDD